MCTSVRHFETLIGLNFMHMEVETSVAKIFSENKIYMHA